MWYHRPYVWRLIGRVFRSVMRLLDDIVDEIDRKKKK